MTSSSDLLRKEVVRRHKCRTPVLPQFEFQKGVLRTRYILAKLNSKRIDRAGRFKFFTINAINTEMKTMFISRRVSASTRWFSNANIGKSNMDIGAARAICNGHCIRAPNNAIDAISVASN